MPHRVYAPAHPVRRLSDRCALYHFKDVSGAGIGILDVRAKLRPRRFPPFKCEKGKFCLLVENARDFPGNTEDAETIASVGRDADVEDGVIINRDSASFRIYFVLRKNEYTAMVVRKTQFLFRTEHAARFDAPQFFLFNNKICRGLRLLSREGPCRLSDIFGAPQTTVRSSLPVSNTDGKIFRIGMLLMFLIVPITTPSKRVNLSTASTSRPRNVSRFASS